MHIHNIVASELTRSGKYSNLSYETVYSGFKAQAYTTIFGNPSYKPVGTDYTLTAPLNYYNKQIDIHVEHGVSPIK